MKAKYVRQIQKCAKKSLAGCLVKMAQPYLKIVPDHVLDSFDSNFIKYELPTQESLSDKDKLGSQLQFIGRELGEKAAPEYFSAILIEIESNLKRDRKTLAINENNFSKSQGQMAVLLNLIRSEEPIPPNITWGGADVIIRSTPQSSDDIKGYSSKTIVVTDSDTAALRLGSLFHNFRDIFDHFLDFRNKYLFYGSLADTAKKSIDNDDDLTTCCLLVWKKAESFRVEWERDYMKDISEKAQYLTEAESWLFKKRIEYDL